jgi:hypothetical protein
MIPDVAIAVDCNVMWNFLHFIFIQVFTLVEQNFESLLSFKNFGLYNNSFTIVIYDHNDSSQYYKTVITIVS